MHGKRPSCIVMLLSYCHHPWSPCSRTGNLRTPAGHREIIAVILNNLMTPSVVRYAVVNVNNNEARCFT